MHHFGERIFRVLPRQENQALSSAMREWLPGAPWSQIHKIIRGRYVQVSGNLCVDPGRRLKLQDVVKLLEHPLPAPPGPAEVTVLHLDEHVVVVDKPSGMTTVRHHAEKGVPVRRKQLQPTLDELLPKIIWKIERRRGRGVPPPVRPVHRLDRDTSGLLVFARTGAAERGLMEQFRKHTTKRRYLAVIHGFLPEKTIESNLVRDRGDGRRGSTDKPNQGRLAVTHIRPLERLGDFALVECRLETGRTHQIRIHLAEAGHTVCGEKVYNRPRFGKERPDTSGAPRLALAAVGLGFIHPITGEELDFEVPLPKDLDDFVHELRRRAARGGIRGKPGRKS